MVKQKKKRNKPYSGAGASITQTSVTRLTAANRNGIQQWWFEKKRIAKPALITSGIVIVVVWLLIELFRIIGGSAA